ncbi:MAG: hypothetical protein HYT48_03630 [Candidatus Vogelbacteria bacterium]|nr:hypothetical protein [Candidatus Vogelbacteria bacterium]
MSKFFRSERKRKFLLLLERGVALGLTRSVGKQKQIIKNLSKELRDIERRYLYRYIDAFYHERLVDYREHQDGSITVVLTEKGKQRTLRYQIEALAIAKPKRWDGRWRVVLFDIPENRRRIRDALRHKLKELGFCEWQKSVFVHPYPCFDELNFVIEFFEARPYVRLAEITKATNDSELRLHFDL